MDIDSGITRAGWSSGESIVMELDIALAALRDYSAGARMPAEFANILEAVPESWRLEIPPVIREMRGYTTILELPAWLAGVLYESDYGRATLLLRDFALEDAIERLRAQFDAIGVQPDPLLPLDLRFVDLGLRGKLALYRLYGLEVPPDSTFAVAIRQEFERALPVLKGGSQHAAFWHWLDRFYFQLYHDWRGGRLPQMKEEEQRLIAALGAPRGAGKAPSLQWLPPQNPLLRFQWLGDAVEQGRMEVFFWIEPFGMADLWGLYPGQVFISFAPPGILYENFEAEAKDVAARANALADPTRLIILRMIRHFGMVNTDIAEYLGLSRPTVSIHAKILREAGLIRSEQVGREVRHTIIPSEVRRLFRDLERFLNLPEDEES